MRSSLEHLALSTRSAAARDRRSFPTRRSSDLAARDGDNAPRGCGSTSTATLMGETLGTTTDSSRAPHPGLWKTEGVSQPVTRSEEHTSELQSHVNLVCRLLLEKKKTQIIINFS